MFQKYPMWIFPVETYEALKVEGNKFLLLCICMNFFHRKDQSLTVILWSGPLLEFHFLWNERTTWVTILQNVTSSLDIPKMKTIPKNQHTFINYVIVITKIKGCCTCIKNDWNHKSALSVRETLNWMRGMRCVVWCNCL